MNRVLVLAGAVLLTLSLLSFALLPYSWTEETTATISTPVLDLNLPAHQMHTIAVPAEISWGVAVAGWVLLLAGVLVRAKDADPPQRRTPPAGPPGARG